MSDDTNKDDGFDRGSAELPPGDSPGTDPTPVTPMEPGKKSDIESNEWVLQRTRAMYTNSTDYLDANITSFWERSLAHFQNQHAPGSSYTRKNFRRSKIFRPKTRAFVKQQEAALANAVFSTMRHLDVQPQNERDPLQRASARVMQELVQYRLEHRMPWYLTVMGAYQDTKVYGLAVSHQYWQWREDVEILPALDENDSMIMAEDPATGQMVPMGEESTILREDELKCDVLEPENFRFDPMCDWRNPAGTSPYLQRIWPMTVGEVLGRMDSDRAPEGKAWIRYDQAQILSTRSNKYDRTRQAREGDNRVDPSQDQDYGEDATVWPIYNIAKIEGVDYVWWTLGTELLLSKPVPLQEECPWLRAGERPFVVGYSTIEAHRNYPAGDVEQSAPSQEEINLVANQRLDNVKLVLNKRYFVRRGSQVDLDSLIRNTPGGGVMMNDPEKDVITQNTPDVTGSSYTEQALLSQELDQLVGGFSPGEGKGGQSVGGQQIARSGAAATQDYGIKTFVETWMEPVLRQLQRLVAMYETDEKILALAGDKADLQRFGMDEITDRLLLQDLVVRVNVGMGNTDPMRRVERLSFGLSQLGAVPGMAMRMKGQQIADEVFGALGYRDASLFFMTDEEFEEYMANQEPEISEMDVKMRELDIRQEDNKLRDERERMKLRDTFEMSEADREAKQDMLLDQLMAQLHQANMSDETKRQLEALKASIETEKANQKMAVDLAKAAEPPAPPAAGGESSGG